MQRMDTDQKDLKKIRENPLNPCHPCSIIFIAIMLSLCVSEASAKAGKSSAAFLKMDVGARTNAMGGIRAVLGNDVTALFSNPAGLGCMEKKELFMDYNQLYQGIGHGHLGLGLRGNKWWYGIGFGQLTVDGIKRQSSKDDRDEGYAAALDSFITGGLAYRVAPGFYAGISGKFIREKLDRDKADAAALDIGGMYKGTNWNYGFSVQNIGQKLKFIEQPCDLPLTLRLGAAYNRNGLTVASELEQLIKDKELYFHLGLEYLLTKAIAMRAGYQSADTNRYSAGLGCKNKNLCFDYAYLPFEKLGDTHRVSFTMRFDKEKKGPALEIEDISIENIFPSKCRYYAENPLGWIRLRNNSDEDITRVQISLALGELTDYPSQYTVSEIPPDSTKEIPLKVCFNKKLFEADEDTPVQANVTVSYYLKGIAKTTPPMDESLILFNKMAVNWRNPKSVSAFVTPNDTPVDSFAKQAIASLKEIPSTQIQGILCPMAIFEALSAYSFFYSDDNRHSYKDIILDNVQYPRRTLEVRTGDCDDYTVLYASCLSSIGKKVILITVPEHIFLAFDTGVAVKNADLVSFDKNSYIVRDGRVWIPLELTMLKNKGSFFDAWKEGMQKYQEWKDGGELEIIDLEEACKTYPPVGLPQSDIFVEKPSGQKINLRIKENMEKLEAYKQKVYKDVIKQYQTKLKSNPHDMVTLNQLGIIYAKAGLLEEAEKLFSEASRYNNLGNVCLLKADYDKALELYKKAGQTDPEDGGIYLNLAICCCLQGKTELAEEAFKEAIRLYPDCEEVYSAMGLELEKAGVRGMEAESVISKIQQLLLKVRREIAKKLSPDEVEKKKISVMGAKEIRGEEAQEPVRLSDEELVKRLCYWKEN